MLSREMEVFWTKQGSNPWPELHCGQRLLGVFSRFLFIVVAWFGFSFSTQGFPVLPWLSWNPLCRPVLSWTQDLPDSTSWVHYHCQVKCSLCSYSQNNSLTQTNSQCYPYWGALKWLYFVQFTRFILSHNNKSYLETF